MCQPFVYTLSGPANPRDGVDRTRQTVKTGLGGGGWLLGCRNTAILTKFHSPSLWIKNNLKNTLEPIENKI